MSKVKMELKAYESYSHWEFNLSNIRLNIGEVQGDKCRISSDQYLVLHKVPSGLEKEM